MRIILDTNAYVAFKGGNPDTIEIIRSAEQISLSVVTLGELLAGFHLGSRQERNRRELSAFLDSPRAGILPIGADTAVFYATVFARLRAKGKPIPTNDLWLAATALEHGLAVATYDAHFTEIDGLVVVQRPEDMSP